MLSQAKGHTDAKLRVTGVHRLMGEANGQVARGLQAGNMVKRESQFQMMGLEI